jgi:hypothetical protein
MPALGLVAEDAAHHRFFARVVPVLVPAHEHLKNALASGADLSHLFRVENAFDRFPVGQAIGAIQNQIPLVPG